MIRDKTRMGNGVTVEKNQIIAARRGNCLIQNARTSEALMFLPDVFAAEGLSRAPLLKHGFGFTGRAVISEQNFVR